MNKRQKEIIQAQLDSEKAVLEQLEKHYARALRDIDNKIRILQSDELTQSRIYRLEYQKALKEQVKGVLEKLHSDEYTTIQQFLSASYTDAFVGTAYDLFGQGVPLIMPIDPEEAVKAVLTDSKISKGLYNALGVDVNKLKKSISAEISRGVAGGMSLNEIARNISSATKAPMSRARTIVQTESHRIQQAARQNARLTAKSKGAEIVKQWNSTLDGETRDTHRKLDGQIRELDEPFEIGGQKAMYPGDFGDPAEDCNCRCEALQRAKWALGEAELVTLKERAKYFDLDKTKDFESFKTKYIKAAETAKVQESIKKEPETIADVNAGGTQMLSEAYERHRTKNGLTSVPYDELGDSADDIVSANYEKMSVESAAVFNDAITELANEYDTPLQRIRTMTKNEALGHGSSFAFVTHNYTVDSAELVINPAKCKDLTKMTDRIKELSEYGYCVKIPDEVAGKYIVTHEFAHTLINLEQPLKNSTNWLGADYGKIKKARKEINSVYEEYLAEVKQLTQVCKETELKILVGGDSSEEAWKAARKATEELNAVKLSNYSLQSADEFMAEAFANEKIGVSSNPYSKAVLDILDKYFKG